MYIDNLESFSIRQLFNRKLIDYRTHSHDCFINSGVFCEPLVAMQNYACCKNLLSEKRYLLAFISIFGILIPLAMRCEIGIAIIKMTEIRQTIIPLPQTNSSINYRVMHQSDVDWDDTKVSLIESSFFIGYTLFSIPGGFLATIIGPNYVFGLSVLWTCGLNLFIPSLVFVNSGFTSVFIFRVLQGLAEGCLYPSVQAFWRHWAPKPERTTLVTISFFGMAIGPIIGYPVTGFLTKRFNWKASFYFWGILGIGWSIVWFIIAKKSPRDDNCISEEERDYIEKNTTNVVIKPNDVPWISIFTSVPVWAIIIANIGRNWTYQFSFSGLPSFFSKKFDTPSVTLGLVMSIPYVVMAILTPLIGVIADYLMRRGYTTTFVRKFFNTLGFGIAGVCFLIMGFIPYMWLTATILSIGLGSFGIGMSGFAVNHLDIADVYAGVLMGISNGIGTLAGILSPIIAMELTKGRAISTGWQMFFIASGCIHLTTTAFYAIFGSGEQQSWVNYKQNKQADEKTAILAKDPEKDVKAAN